MHHPIRLLRRAAAAVTRAERWHHQMLTNPLYAAAMQLIAALLIGHIGSDSIHAWLRRYA